MKKVSTAVAKQSRNISQQKLIIGLDLGDRNSCYCVGERRSVRPVAQQQPNDSGGRSVKHGKTKSKSFQEEKRQKPKAEFR